MLSAERVDHACSDTLEVTRATERLGLQAANFSFGEHLLRGHVNARHDFGICCQHLQCGSKVLLQNLQLHLLDSVHDAGLTGQRQTELALASRRVCQ